MPQGGRRRARWTERLGRGIDLGDGGQKLTGDRIGETSHSLNWKLEGRVEIDWRPDQRCAVAIWYRAWDIVHSPVFH